MKYKNFLYAFFALILFLPTIAGARDTPAQAVETKIEKVFNAKHYTLENGLEIVVVENHRAPVLTHMVWYRTGAADEQMGKSGIAHFLEHLMFKGQHDEKLGDIASGEFSKIIRALGGQDNAFTSHDYTAYFQSIASDQLETVMKMEAGRMRGLAPPLAEVKSENLVILEERRQRTDNDPKAQMGEQLNHALFPNHPYGKPVIGWLHEMEGLTWDDAKNFYDQHYAPNNAILVVSGDVTGERVLEIAKKTYGVLEKRNVPERTRTVSPPFISSAAITLTHDTIREPIFLRAYRVPSARNNKPDSLALSILQEIFGNGAPSRLYKSLVIRQKIASSVSFDYDSSAWDDSTAEISAIPLSGISPQAIKDAVDAELRLLIKDGITDQELKDAVTRMQSAAIYARDSVAGPAMMIGHALITGSSLDDIEYWPRDLATITKENVQNAARRYLNPDAPSLHPPVEGYLLPRQEGK